jgi:hypothetical protein
MSVGFSMVPSTEKDAPRNGDRVAIRGSTPSGSVLKIQLKNLQRDKELSEPGPESTRQQRRHYNELCMRVLALERKLDAYKAVPKEKRLLSQRIGRMQHAQQRSSLTLMVQLEEDALDVEQVESQSGYKDRSKIMKNVIGTAASAAVGIAALKATKLLDRTAPHLTSLTKTVDEMASGISNSSSGFVGQVKETIESMKGFFGSWWKIPALLLLYSLVRSYASMQIVSIVIIPIAMGICKKIWGHLRSFFEGSKIESQSGMLDTSTFVATLTSCLLVPKKDPAIMVGEIQRRVANAERTSSGLSFLFEGALRHFESVVNWLASLVTDKRVQWTSQLDRLLDEWSKKVDDFEVMSIKENPSLPQLNGAMRLLQEGVGFRQTVKTTHNMIFLNKYMDRLTGAIQAHRGALAQASSFRMQPICLMLGGASGVGKTTLLKWLASSIMLLSKSVDASEVLNNMWQKGISEYWNGYVQQFVYIMDDCFQQKTDGKQLDNEAMFLIRAVGNWAFPLNFADLDSKGRFYFMSNVIMGSTNVVDINAIAATMVNEPAAVTRRIQHGYWVTVNKDFARDPDVSAGVRTLDYSKVNSYLKNKRAALGSSFTVSQLLECIPWEAWNITPHSFNSALSNDFVKNDFTLLDLARKVAAEYTVRSAEHVEEVTELQDWATDIAKCLVDEETTSPVVSQSGFDLPGKSDLEAWALDSVSSEIIAELPSSLDGKPILRKICVPQTYAQRYPNASVEGEIPTCDTPKIETWEERMDRRARWIDEKIKGERARRDWIGDALNKMAKWCDAKKLPAVLKNAISFIDVHDVEHFETGTDKTTVFWRNFCRLVRLGLLGLLVGCLVKLSKALVGLVSDVFERMFGRVKSQSNMPDSPRTKKGDISVPRLYPQLGNPPQDSHAKRAFNNTYKIYLMRDGAPVILGQILFIEGDLCIMPSHFRKELREETGNPMIHFMSSQQTHFSTKMPLKKFLDLKGIRPVDTDVEFVKFERSMLKAHRSIAHHFLREADLKSFFKDSCHNVRLDIARMDKNGDKWDLTKTTYTSNVCEWMQEGHMVQGLGVIRGMCRYEMPTIVGDCGAPLALCEPRFFGGRAIIGIHIAGKTGRLVRHGYAQVISSDLIYHARSELDTYVDDLEETTRMSGVDLKEVTPEVMERLEQSGLLGGSFLPLGMVEKEQAVHMNNETKLFLSPLGEDQVFGPPPTLPAHMGPVRTQDGVIFPMVKAMEAYQAPLEIREIPNMEAIVEMAMKPHWANTQRHGRHILTFEEAVVPREGMKLKPIPRGTSSGYPFRIEGIVGKFDFFGAEGDYDFSSPQCERLRRLVDRLVYDARQNSRSCVIFTDFLKDELRPLEKVKNVVSRAISGAPLDYVIAVRMYFGSFIAAMFDTFVVNGMSPGINPYTDWHLLAEKLQSKGKNIFGGDFKRFDASEQPYLFEYILGYINRWYKKSTYWCQADETCRNVLWLDLIHSRHLAGVDTKSDILLQWNKSLPSGHPLTTVVTATI